MFVEAAADNKRQLVRGREGGHGDRTRKAVGPRRRVRWREGQIGMGDCTAGQAHCEADMQASWEGGVAWEEVATTAWIAMSPALSCCSGQQHPLRDCGAEAAARGSSPNTL